MNNFFIYNAFFKHDNFSMKINKKKIFFYLLLLSLFIVFLSYRYIKESKPKSMGRKEIIDSIETKDNKPDFLNIKMTFYPQAPYADWSMPYQEACEEASVLLAANLFKEINLDREGFHVELLKLVEWEKERFGDYLHTDIRQTESIINEYFNLKTTLHENPTLDKIASIIAKGNIIIAPFAGKLLENPYFTNGGPRYHMLVIKGYNLATKEIITHDVGTRRGENYMYSWDRIWTALHDWHEQDMLSGKKMIIEVFP